MPELLPRLRFRWSLADGDPVWDVLHPRAHIALAVLEPVAAVLEQVAAIAPVLPDEMVYPLHQDHRDAVGVTVSFDLLRRPLLPLHTAADERLHQGIHLPGFARALFRIFSEHLRHAWRIPPVGAAVALELLAHRGLRHAYGPRYLQLRFLPFLIR